MDALCPACAQPMNWADGDYHCQICNRHYRQIAECPDCGQPLQQLKACGAVDYLCQQGHGLISKKRVKFSYQPR
ncbi:primosomal protein N' (replication factor Y) - superfamily II helicase [Serratia sp. S1B]|nr:primosomal protein N' (replication factor Y) - superfamily II helicase [Serratia sp. S1B]